MLKFSIQFPDSSFPALDLEEGRKLSEAFTVENSPILFGCRTGICGTCLVTVDAASDALPAANAAEREVLDMIAAHEPKARLACQIRATCEMAIKALDEDQ